MGSGGEMKESEDVLYELIIIGSYDSESLFKGSYDECLELRDKIDYWFSVAEKELQIEKVTIDETNKD